MTVAPPHFQREDVRTLDELAAEIEFIEGFPVWLKCEDKRYFKPYPTRYASPPNMRGREWVEQFEKLYPDVDLTFLDEARFLGELRKKPAP
ncbi:MAG: hypothetical protein ACYCZU_01765 [Devosia sp.]